MPIAPSEKPAGAPGAPFKSPPGGVVVIAVDSSNSDVFHLDSNSGFLFQTPITMASAIAMGGHKITGGHDAQAATDIPTYEQVSAAANIAAGALPTVQLVSGTAYQPPTINDTQVHTPVTFSPGAATIATCTVALSPDNTTFSTLCVWTEPVGVVLAGTIHDVAACVPQGWYLKLTVNAQAVLGLSTYY